MSRVYLFRLAEILVIVTLMALIVRWLVISPFKVRSNSLEPQFFAGDLVLAYRLQFGLKLPFINKRIGFFPPARKDYVLYVNPEHADSLVMKRVVALPGDVVTIKSEQIYINDAPSDVTTGLTDDRLQHPYNVPQDFILVADEKELGRSIGQPVPLSWLRAKVVLILFSTYADKSNHSRTLSPVH